MIFGPDWVRKRKRVKMLVEVSIPANMSAAQARKEVKSLVTHGAGHLTYAGEAVRAISVKSSR